MDEIIAAAQDNLNSTMFELGLSDLIDVPRNPEFSEPHLDLSK